MTYIWRKDITKVRLKVSISQKFARICMESKNNITHSPGNVSAR